MSATLVMATALGIGRFAYTPLLPEMVEAFGWTFAVAGDVASANFVGYMAGALLAPKVIASQYVRFWFAFCLLGTAATTYIGAEVSSYLGWLVVRFASGVVSAFCLIVVTTKLIHVLQAEGRESLGNVHFAGVGMGIVLCMIAVFQPGDVETQWARLGILSAVVAAMAWLLTANLPFAPQQQSLPQDEKRGLSPHLWRLIVGYGLFGYGYVVAATFIVAMAQSMEVSGAVGVREFDARTAWLVVGLSLAPSVYVWQWLSNRYGLLGTLRAAYLVEAGGLVLAGISTGYISLLIACVLLGGTFGAITALGISAAKAAAPQRVAFTVSVMTIAFALGQLLGPAISGRLADWFGDFVWASLIAACMLVIAALLVGRGDAKQVGKETSA